MDIKYIKVGETYNIRVRVVLIEPNRIVCRPLNQDGTPSDFCPNYFNFAEAEAFSPISPENGIKNTETAPKYDPNRKFRKGDIVKPCQVKGRWQSITWKGRSGIHFTVTEDEDEDGIVSIKDPDCKLPSITSAVFLELVTPVEELEPYIVVDAHTHWDVADKNMKTVAMYSKGNHPHAKEAAEAERDRLNEEHRKEQK